MRKIIIFLFVSILFNGQMALAISEDNFQEEYKNKVIPYFLNQGKFGTFDGVKGIKIKYAAFERKDEDCALVFLTGRNECVFKYAEIFYDLQDFSCSIYIMDHRGQGNSGRMLSNARKGHVEKFDDYLDDVKLLIEKVVNQRSYRKKFLIGHSMGGMVAIRMVERYPRLFDAMVLLAPMIEFLGASELVFYLIASTKVFIGQGKDSFLGSQIDVNKTTEDFPDNDLTGSYERYKVGLDVKKNHMVPLYPLPTYNWVKESIIATWNGIKDVDKIEIPFLLFQAGEDTVISRYRQNELCRRAKKCRKIILPTARHEIMMEKDLIRDPLFRRIMVHP